MSEDLTVCSHVLQSCREKRPMYIRSSANKKQTSMHCSSKVQFKVLFEGREQLPPQLNDNTSMLFMHPCSHIWLKGASSRPVSRGGPSNFGGGTWGTEVEAGEAGRGGKWVHEKSKLQHSITERLPGCLSSTDWLYSTQKEDLRLDPFFFP